MAAPLEGLKILDLTPLLPGPYATMLLADMGAEVLRIEAPSRPDLLRLVPPFVEEGVSAAQATINRNKKSLTLNLKSEDGQKILLELLNEYDILIEQFRPGVMQRLGLDYETLKQKHPELIYCSITGYGQTGPLKDKGGHDINYLALSGLSSYSGKPETGPVLSGTQIADVAGGSHHAVMGILAAVIERSRTGAGQHVDISMTDAMLAMNTLFAAASLAEDKSPGFATEQLNGGIFYDYYPTADGRSLAVGSLEPQFFKALCTMIDKPEWEPRFLDYRPEIQHSLKEDLTQVFQSRTFAEWQEALANVDACIEPVLTLTEATSHPHYNERDMLCTATTTQGQSVNQVASPIRFNGTRQNHCDAGVPLGHDSQSVLSDLGYSAEEIQHLIDSGVITAPQ